MTARLVITIPPVSIARELWRLAEPDLASRAVRLTPEEAADIGERAGDLHLSGDASRLWPDGPSGATPAVLLATIEYVEGTARPCRRNRRLPEKQLSPELQLTEDERWVAAEPVHRETNRRLNGPAT
jgi:hypothetical protein